MDPPEADSPTPRGNAWGRRESIYALSLFASAVATLGVVTFAGARPFDGIAFPVLAFFVLLGLGTIAIGYEHSNVGYYSFDRVAQVASILVLGPIAAAWVNGTASLLYPWHRLYRGVPLREVCLAALNNAGLMSLVVLIGGSLYAGLGGAVPLETIDGRTAALLVALVLMMQALNDLGMYVMLKLGRRNTTGFFQPFSIALELGSGATAVLVALVYNTESRQLLVLLLGVLTIGMLALRQFARMRLRLERIVEERTRSLREKTRELEELAMQDNLTGLFNRRYAEAFLERQLARAGRDRRAFSIALADIDRFKQINDRHSHATGDEVIKRVADTLRERCRRVDMIARYGGEEFLICFPGTSLSQARRICEDLRRAIEHQDWQGLGLADSVTISFGIAEGRHESSASAIVHMADLRLYSAKESGRNLVVA